MSKHKSQEQAMPEQPAQYAFRCKTCGYLHPAEHAGENDVPHACVVCGGGISHSPTVEEAARALADPDCTPERRLAIAAQLAAAARHQEQKTWQPENWEVLAEATPERLAELGLEPQQVTRHTPKVRTVPTFGRHVTAEGQEQVASKDKE